MTSGLQAALYTAIDAATTVPIYDYVPQTTVFPYIRLGNSTSIPFDTDTDTGFEETINVHVYSNYRGNKEVQTIQAQIYTALHMTKPTVTGYNVLGVDQEYCDDGQTESDGLTRHGIQRFRVIMEKI